MSNNARMAPSYHAMQPTIVNGKLVLLRKSDVALIIATVSMMDAINACAVRQLDNRWHARICFVKRMAKHFVLDVSVVICSIHPRRNAKVVFAQWTIHPFVAME